MNTIDEMYKLIDQLNYYTKLYDEGHPEISDEDWDKLYFLLSRMEEKSGIVLSNSPTHHVNYQVVSKLNKVEHNHPMLSLDKTKSQDEVAVFLGDQNGIAMAKMDGLTCSLWYEKGVLVRAETRGNGLIGEDITQNIISAKGVPVQIPSQQTLIIDGEIICTYQDFEEFSEEYKNPRNFASGSIRLLDSKESAKRKLTFIAWDCVKGLDEYKTLVDKLLQLDKMGFIFVPFINLPENATKEIINHAIILLKQTAADAQYPIDGIVFKYNDCAYYQSLGYTEHHFRGGLAYKFYDENYETKLRNIEWTMGKTGQLTPVAIFDPVDDGESTITRASLHNLNIMEQTLGANPFNGQTIYVCKMNQIIPQVVRSENGNEGTVYYLDKEVFVYPDKCPICGGKTIVKDDFLYCDNPSCDGKFINQLVHFCGKKGLDIKGLSEATLQKLVDWGWVNNYHELFTLELYVNEWKQKPGFGIKSVDNILSAIQDARDCDLWQFISALSIPNIGSTYAKQIAKNEKTWDNFISDIESGFDFSSWDGFGYEMNRSLLEFDYKEANELVKNVLYLHNNLILQETVESNINGKNIVITGKLTHYKNRDELKEDIEKHGGKVVSSVSSKTHYLVNNDINSTSSKNVSAKKLGIPIITEEDLIALF